VGSCSRRAQCSAWHAAGVRCEFDMALRALVSLPGLTGPGPTQRRPASALCNARPVGRSTSLFRRISNWPITRHNGPSPCSAKATESEGNSGTGSSTGLYRGGLDPSLEQAVPRDQRPANELQAIKEASLYNWVWIQCCVLSRTHSL